MKNDSSYPPNPVHLPAFTISPAAHTLPIHIRMQNGTTYQAWQVFIRLSAITPPTNKSPTLPHPITVPWVKWGPVSTRWIEIGINSPYHPFGTHRFARIQSNALHVLDFKPHGQRSPFDKSDSPRMWPTWVSRAHPTKIKKPDFWTWGHLGFASTVESKLPYRDIIISTEGWLDLWQLVVLHLGADEIILCSVRGVYICWYYAVLMGFRFVRVASRALHCAYFKDWI